MQGETRQRHQRQHKKDEQGKPLLQHICPFCYDRIEANPLPPKGNATQSLHAVRQLNNSQVFTTQQSCFKIKCKIAGRNSATPPTATQKGRNKENRCCNTLPLLLRQNKRCFLRQTLSTATASCNGNTAHFNRGKNRACCPKQGKAVTSQRNKKNVPKNQDAFVVKRFCLYSFISKFSISENRTITTISLPSPSTSPVPSVSPGFS